MPLPVPVQPVPVATPFDLPPARQEFVAPYAAPSKAPSTSPAVWVALAVVGMAAIGGLGWMLGRSGNHGETIVIAGATPAIASASPSSTLAPVTPTPAPTRVPLPAAAPPPTAKPAPTAVPPVRWEGEKFPETRTTVLTEADISDWSYDDVRYALNEIYARHGYDFQNPTVRRLFMQEPWYAQVRVPGRSQQTAENLCSPTENANRSLLAARRDELANQIPG